MAAQNRKSKQTQRQRQIFRPHRTVYSHTKPKPFREVLWQCYQLRQERAQQADKNFQLDQQMRQFEHERLFGYVITIYGKKLTVEEARQRIEQHKLTRAEILDWHNPQIYFDEVLSIGERDSLDTFPTLKIDHGDVLYDPKIQYCHPSLRQ
jgi:lipoprotein NlpI